MTRPGMTLVGTLVGLMVLALVMMLGLFALGLVGRAGTAASVDFGAVGAAQDLLRLRLAGAMPLVGEGRAGRLAMLFEGAADRLAFPAELPARFGTPGPALVELRNGEDGLLLFWRRVPGEANGEGAAGRILLEGTESLGLRYFGSPRASQPPGWHADWTEATALPILVEIVVTFRDGDRRRWPPLTVAPRFAGPPGVLSEGSVP